MSQPIKSIVNTDVFIRCHFFDIFMNLMISGPCLDLILDTFGGLGTPVCSFLGVLKNALNLHEFQGPTRTTQSWGNEQVEGKVILQGVQYSYQ